MSIRTANNRSSAFTTERINFQANNLHGETRDGVYIIFSYGWYPLYVHKGGQWYENKDKYSRTTSKQKTQSRPLCVEFIELTHKNISELYFTE